MKIQIKNQGPEGVASKKQICQRNAMEDKP
jgi:hypothetical protein